MTVSAVTMKVFPDKKTARSFVVELFFNSKKYHKSIDILEKL